MIMSILSKLFGRSKETENEQENVIERETFVDDSEPSEDVRNIVTIQYGTGFPIDAIYAFVRKDLEEEGYNDALCCPDNSYKDRRIKIIKNELKTLLMIKTMKVLPELKEK